MVGHTDVAAIWATVDHFATLDDRFDGGLGREALITFLSRGVQPLLSASCTEEVRRALFSAAGN
jgi:hypothetical protein